MSAIHRDTGQGARHRAALRFLDERIVADAVEFDALDDSGERIRFAIGVETLREITDSPDGTSPSTMFVPQRDRIRGVAARAYNAGVRGTPIELRASMFPVF